MTGPCQRTQEMILGCYKGYNLKWNCFLNLILIYINNRLSNPFSSFIKSVWFKQYLIWNRNIHVITTIMCQWNQFKEDPEESLCESVSYVAIHHIYIYIVIWTSLFQHCISKHLYHLVFIYKGTQSCRFTETFLLGLSLLKILFSAMQAKLLLSLVKKKVWSCQHLTRTQWMSSKLGINTVISQKSFRVCHLINYNTYMRTLWFDPKASHENENFFLKYWLLTILPIVRNDTHTHIYIYIYLFFFFFWGGGGGGVKTWQCFCVEHTWKCNISVYVLYFLKWKTSLITSIAFFLTTSPWFANSSSSCKKGGL